MNAHTPTARAVSRADLIRVSMSRNEVRSYDSDALRRLMDCRAGGQIVEG